MSSDVVLPIATALVAAAAALAGNYLTPRMDQKREHASWLRDKKAAAAEGFYRQMRLLLEVLDSLSAQTSGGHIPTQANMDRLNVAHSELIAAVDPVLLYFPPQAVRGGIASVVNGAARIMQLLTDTTLSDTERLRFYTQARKRLSESELQARLSIRQQLGIE